MRNFQSNDGVTDSPPQAPDDALHTWLERLAGQHLPLLPESARLLSGISPQSGMPVDRLCGATAADPGAVLEVLRRANAPRRKNLSNRVATLENAAQMLGVAQVQSLPDSLAVVPMDRQSQDVQAYLQVVVRSYHAGLQAYHWAVYRGERVPKEVFTAGLLHDVGEMMLALHGGVAELKRIRQLQRLERMPADEAQYVVLGFSLEQLSLGLARRWNLPELLLQSLEAEYAQQPRVLGVMLAAQLARLSEMGWYGEDLQECLEGAATLLEVPVDDLSVQARIHAVEAARDVAHIANLPSARRLPMLPGEEPAEEGDGPEAEPEPDGPVHFCLMPQWAVYDEVVARLEDHGLDLNLHDLMTHVMRALHDGLGLNRVVFAMLSRDRSVLQARYLAGTDNDPAFSQFRLNMERNHLFSRLLEREQAVWLNEENHARFWPLVPDGVKKLIQTDTFFAASVVVEAKPIGLFYADRHLPDSRLDANAYQRFKRLSQLSSQAIGRLRNGTPAR